MWLNCYLISVYSRHVLCRIHTGVLSNARLGLCDRAINMKVKIMIIAQNTHQNPIKISTIGATTDGQKDASLSHVVRGTMGTAKSHGRPYYAQVYQLALKYQKASMSLTTDLFVTRLYNGISATAATSTLFLTGK